MSGAGEMGMGAGDGDGVGEKTSLLYSGLSIRRVVMMRSGGDDDVRGGEATHRVATVHEGDECVHG